MNQVTSASLRYPLSVFNKNSTLKSKKVLLRYRQTTSGVPSRVATALMLVFFQTIHLHCQSRLYPSFVEYESDWTGTMREGGKKRGGEKRKQAFEGRIRPAQSVFCGLNLIEPAQTDI